MFKKFFHTRDLSAFRKALEQQRIEHMEIAKDFLQERQKARRDYEKKRTAALKAYQEWVEIHVPSTSVLPAIYADCDLVRLFEHIVKQWEIGRVPLQRFLDENRNTILHLWLPEYFIAGAELQKKQQPMIELVIRRGCSPCAQNRLKLMGASGKEYLLRENAFDYSNRILELRLGSQTANQLPPWWLLEVALECMATYSPAEESVRVVVLRISREMRKNLEGTFSRLFVNKLMLMAGKQSVVEIIEGLYEALALGGCDSLVLEPVQKLLFTPQDEGLKSTPLYRSLREVMILVNKGDLMALPVTEKMILRKQIDYHAKQIGELSKELIREKEQWAKDKAKAPELAAERAAKQKAELEEKISQKDKIVAKQGEEILKQRQTLTFLVSVLQSKLGLDLSDPRLFTAQQISASEVSANPGSEAKSASLVLEDASAAPRTPRSVVISETAIPEARVFPRPLSAGADSQLYQQNGFLGQGASTTKSAIAEVAKSPLLPLPQY